MSMGKMEILEELPKLTKTERQEIRLRLAELESEDWLDDEDPVTDHEKALLDAHLAAYAKDPDAGSTWEEVEGRILSYAAASTLWRRRSNPARPYMDRLMAFNRLICPSTGPVLQGSVKAACTASRS